MGKGNFRVKQKDSFVHMIQVPRKPIIRVRCNWACCLEAILLDYVLFTFYRYGNFSPGGLKTGL